MSGGQTKSTPYCCRRYTSRGYALHVTISNHITHNKKTGTTCCAKGVSCMHSTSITLALAPCLKTRYVHENVSGKCRLFRQQLPWVSLNTTPPSSGSTSKYTRYMGPDTKYHFVSTAVFGYILEYFVKSVQKTCCVILAPAMTYWG